MSKFKSNQSVGKDIRDALNINNGRPNLISVALEANNQTGHPTTPSELNGDNQTPQGLTPIG